MPRYYLNIADEHVAHDPDGVELPDLAAAYDEAVGEARDLLADGARQGLDRSAWRVVICDENSATVLLVGFKEAMRPDTLPALRMAQHEVMLRPEAGR